MDRTAEILVANGAVKTSVLNTELLDKERWKTLLEKRQRNYACENNSQLRDLLANGDWLEVHNHPLKPESCRVFRHEGRAKMGMSHIRDLPKDVILIPQEDRERNGVYLVASNVDGDVATFTSLLTGLREGAEVVLDFYPGDIMERTIKGYDEIYVGTPELSKDQAIAMGFEVVVLMPNV